MKISNETKIGHIHLMVSDLERSVKFYTEVLGFTVKNRISDSAAFLAAGNYHHHIGLNTWESKGGTPPPTGHTGIFHFAILLPNRIELAKVYKNILDQNYPLDGAADHDVSEAIYLQDPDGIGVELYVDRDESEWERSESGEIKMGTKRLYLENLLQELN